MPAMTFNAVLLPAPLGPTRPKVEPLGIVIEACRSAQKPSRWEVAGPRTARSLSVCRRWVLIRNRFETSIPGMVERMAVYDGISTRYKPQAPHYYLGAIGIDPRLHGRGLGMQLLDAFCRLSAEDPLSGGVYLETARESNVNFYARRGFSEVGCGKLDGATLWCMYLPHAPR